MREVLPEIERWHAAGHRVALATVVQAWGSAPRPIGAKLAVRGDGAMAGSVSGGCVEGAVVEEAVASLDAGVVRLLDYGVSDETAWQIGLSCGGRIAIFVEPLEVDDPLFDELAASVASERLVARVIALTDGERGRRLLVYRDGMTRGGLGSAELDEAAADAAAEGLERLKPGRLEVSGTDLFVEVYPPRAKLIIVGAVHAAIPLVGFAKALGFRTVVVDPRTAFATAERFAAADELRTDWPDEALGDLGLDENSYVALLSHDLKLDLPALRVALASPARYIGALGSRKTHAKRLAALREESVDEASLERIHSPIGLDLGGRRAEEIALSVAAEIVAVRHGKSSR